MDKNGLEWLKILRMVQGGLENSSKIRFDETP